MSAAIDDGRRDKRYDCFISMPGSQKLTDLGFSWARPDDDVRSLARDVYHHLCAFSRNPSVFYDREELKGDNYREDLSKAVLQLRGGGVALVLFSAQYLKRKWCLAELHSFLHLNGLGRNRAGEAVFIRVVCLESPDSQSIKQAMVEPVNNFVGNVEKLQWQYLEQENSVSTRPQVVRQIYGHVLDYWKENEHICLGLTISEGVHWIQRSFKQDALSVARLAEAFGFQAQREHSREVVFSEALRAGKFDASSPSGSLSDTLKALRKTTGVCSVWNTNGSGGAEKALTAFGRKWDSADWDWSIESGNRDTCLVDFVAQAADVLKRVEEIDTSPSAVAGPSSFGAAPPPVLRNGDTFHSPHLFAGQLSRVGLEARAATHLDSLKRSVLLSARGQSQHRSTSEPRCIALTSIHGEGGVGKTSTCKLLCADKDVRDAYSDGAIIWINVGRGATEEGVMGELGAAVLSCGGERTAEMIKSFGDIVEAVKIASEFFYGRRLLVIVDNVWESTNSRVENWGLELSKIASSGSVVIVTTRFEALAKNRYFDRVHLGRFDLSTADSPDWVPAEHLYDERIGATAGEITNAEYTDNRRKALNISCGLPLGISTFAALVLRRRKCIGGAGRILTLIDDKVVKLVDESAEDMLTKRIGHDGLFCAMDECLIHLDKNDSSFVIPFQLPPRMNREGEEVRRVFDASYSSFPQESLSSRYAALAMMPTSSTRLPFSTLRYLWHVKTSDDAEDIAVIFADIGLGSVEKKDPRSGQEGGFSLHDLQYQFCTHKSESFSVKRAGNAAATCSYWSGHSLFLSSCESFLDPVEASDDLGTGWVKFCTKESSDYPAQVLADYLRRNLFHHMLAITSKIGTDDGLDTLADIIVRILCDFRWIRGRYVADGRAFILSDCSAALEMKVGVGVDSGHGDKLLSARREEYVRGLQSALVFFEGDVSLELDGPLASVLLQRARSTMGSYFRKLAFSAEKRVHGPFLKALAGCGRSWDVGVSKKNVRGNML